MKFLFQASKYLQSKWNVLLLTCLLFITVIIAMSGPTNAQFTSTEKIEGKIEISTAEESVDEPEDDAKNHNSKDENEKEEMNLTTDNTKIQEENVDSE